MNVKDKLRMTRAEKFDAAFRLVKKGTKTYEHIKDLTTVSLRTINTMAKVLRECPKAVEGNSWRSAWWAYKQPSKRDDDEFDRKIDWREEKAQKLAKQMIINVGAGFVRDHNFRKRPLRAPAHTAGLSDCAGDRFGLNPHAHSRGQGLRQQGLSCAVPPG